MKKKYLSKLENKYYYGISRYFWHIVSAIAILGIIAAIGIVGWSYLPTSKEEVVKQSAPVKESYPAEAQVTLAEIIDALPKEKATIDKIKEEVTTETVIENNQNSPKGNDTIGYGAYLRQIAILKNLLPTSEYSTLWNGQGSYIYPEGIGKYRVTKLERYRKFVKTSQGLQEKIEQTTSRNGFTSYTAKARILATINEFLIAFDKETRRKLINPVLRFKNETPDKTIESIKILGSSLQLYAIEDIEKAFDTNERFLRNNRNEGIPLITYENKLLSSFSISERLAAAAIFKQEHAQNYNYNLNALIENTNGFIPFASRIEATKQAIALNFYYTIYENKNSDRARRIQEIDNNHSLQLAEIEQQFQAAKLLAEGKYQTKKQVKSIWRDKSAMGMAIGLGAILLITIILLLLSMVRNVNRLAQAMLENNKSNPEETASK